MILHIVISDYQKGVLNKKIIEFIIKKANQLGCKVIIDSKQKDLNYFKNSYLITPNYKEFCEIVGNKIDQENIKITALKLCKKYNIENILITLGKDGMQLINADGGYFKIESDAKQVFDVTGAGDTVIATIAIGLAANLSIKKSVFLANKAAGIAVGFLGTARVYKTDLKKSVLGGFNNLTKT